MANNLFIPDLWARKMVERLDQSLLPPLIDQYLPAPTRWEKIKYPVLSMFNRFKDTIRYFREWPCHD